MRLAPLELPIVAEGEGGDVWMVVTIGPDSVAEWLLRLCLLRYGLASTISLHGTGGTPTLRIGLSSAAPTQGRSRWDDDGVTIFAEEGEVDYWIRFFLDYYATGRSPVDHVDVLAWASESNSRKDLQVVLQLRQRENERTDQQRGRRRARRH